MDHVRSMGHGSTQREEVCSQDWTGRVWRCAARTRWTERCGRVCHTHGARETPVGCSPSLDERGLARRCGRCIHTTPIPQGDSHDFVSRVTSDPDNGGIANWHSAHARTLFATDPRCVRTARRCQHRSNAAGAPDAIGQLLHVRRLHLSFPWCACDSSVGRDHGNTIVSIHRKMLDKIQLPVKSKNEVERETKSVTQF